MITISLVILVISAAVFLWRGVHPDVKELAKISYFAALLALLLAVGARVLL